MIPVARNRVAAGRGRAAPAAADRRLIMAKNGTPRQRTTGQPPARPAHALKQRRLRLLDSDAREVLVEGLRRPVMSRHVVALPPFSCSRSHPLLACRK